MTTDYLTQRGAEILAARLEAYWRREGYVVKAVVRPIKGRVASNGSLVYAVELPGFVGGLPPQWARGA